jgi:signal transduction histidine kinase
MPEPLQAIASAGDLSLSFMAVLDAVPAQIVVLDPRGLIRAVNAAWRRHAVSQEDAPVLDTGTNYLSACETEGATRESLLIADGIRAVLRGTLREFSLEYGCVTQAGPRYLQLLAAALPLGEQRGAILLHLDVTDRHQAEEHLRRSETRLAEAQALAQVGSWEWNPRTDAMWWSAQMFRLLGHEPGSIVPTTALLLEAVHEEDREGLQPALLMTRPAGPPIPLEFRVRRAGTICWLRGCVSLDRNATGDPVLLRGTLQDVTATRQAEEERLRLERRILVAQKLESLGLLAGGVAHDFNNMLAAIIGHVSIARQFPIESTESLREIEKAAHRAADLCQQMLAFAGKGQIAVALVDLNVLVRETTGLLRGTIARSVKPIFDLSEQLPPLRADATQLRQIVMNLVLNAAEAMRDQGGIIRLATRLVDLTRAQLDNFDEQAAHAAPGPHVELRISDTGPGMSPEVLARIFEPFYTTKPNGRGLGLAAVLGIIRSHHGVLHVESTPGQGSTFTVLLPVAEADEPLAELN